MGEALRTPADAFRHAIETWEGGYQSYPQDAGNWVALPDGKKRLVGTNLGVTPATLAMHRGVHPSTITADQMKTLSIEEAVDIGLAHYYQGPGFNRLPWGPVVEVWCDIGWGSGPRTAIQNLQHLIGTGSDGIIGPYTRKAFEEWIAWLGDEKAVEQTCEWRKGFYRRIVQIRPQNQIFLQGWLNRANHYLPDTEWWATWQ